MNNFKKTKITLIISLTLFFMVLSANAFWYSYVSGEAISLVNLKSELSDEINQSRNFSGLDSRLKELKEKEAIIDQIFVDKNEAVLFIEKVENLAHETGVTIEIQNVNAKMFDSDEVYGYIEMILKASGTWTEVNSLIVSVENLPHHVRINSLRLDSTSLATGIIWNTNLSITVLTN